MKRKKKAIPGKEIPDAELEVDREEYEERKARALPETLFIDTALRRLIIESRNSTLRVLIVGLFVIADLIIAHIATPAIFPQISTSTFSLFQAILFAIMALILSFLR